MHLAGREKKREGFEEKELIICIFFLVVFVFLVIFVVNCFVCLYLGDDLGEGFFGLGFAGEAEDELEDELLQGGAGPGQLGLQLGEGCGQVFGCPGQALVV